MRLHLGTTLLGPDGNPLQAAGVMEHARRVEAAGFNGIWMGDSVGHFNNMTRPDPLDWLLVSAAATETLEVGTCILIVPLRNPVNLAVRFYTLQALTNGRFTMGVGTGSERHQYEAMGVPFEGRFKILSASLDKMKRLSMGEEVEGAVLNPWPVTRGGPPIMIGAYASGLWVKRAASQYDGWIASASRTNVATIGEGIKRFRDAGGKRAAVCSVFFDLTAEDKPLAADEPFNLRCGPKAAAERLAQLADLGYDDVIVVKQHKPPLRYYEPDVTLEELEQVRSLLPLDTRKPWTN